MIGTAIMIVGLVFLALAGKRRERDAGSERRRRAPDLRSV